MIKVTLKKDEKIGKKSFKKGNTPSVSNRKFIELVESKSIEIPKNAKKVIPSEIYEHLVTNKLLQEK